MESIEYSIINDTLNSKIINFNLIEEIETDVIEPMLKFAVNGDIIEIFFAQALDEFDAAALDWAVNNTTGNTYPKAKILNMVKEEVGKLHYSDINYKIHTNTKLFNEMSFIHGELQNTEYFLDEELTDKVLIVDNLYERDMLGSAVHRDTTRRWIREDGSLTDPITKRKKYSNIEQIKEGKRRRGNIVDGIQLPIMGMMIEVLGVEPYNYSSLAILSIGRDFLDDHEEYFNKFIKNSSTVTDPQDPDFGLKKVVVQIKISANTTATWLKLKPLQLDPTGNTSIEDYMIAEFTI